MTQPESLQNYTRNTRSQSNQPTVFQVESYKKNNVAVLSIVNIVLKFEGKKR